MNNLDEALLSQKEALDTAKKEGYLILEAKILENIGNIYLKKENKNEASRYLKNSLEIFIIINNKIKIENISKTIQQLKDK
jgi:hypothetical protein